MLGPRFFLFKTVLFCIIYAYHDLIKYVIVVYKRITYRVTIVIELQLQTYASKFLQDYFDLPFDIPVKRNNRLQRSLGRYLFNKDGEPVGIELAGNLLDYGTEKTVIAVLKHECIHYAFHLQGKEMSDGHPHFENTLKKYNAASTDTLKVGKYYIYQCVKCQQVNESRLKRLAKYTKDYRTSCCRAHLRIIGEKIYRGIE